MSKKKLIKFFTYIKQLANIYDIITTQTTKKELKILNKTLIKIHKKGKANSFIQQIKFHNLYYFNAVNIHKFLKDLKKDKVKNDIRNNCYENILEVPDRFSNISDSFKKVLSTLRTHSGVYFFSDKNEVLYIGKSKKLGIRALDSFTNKEFNSNKKQIYFQYITTNNETDAALLEILEINKHFPLYNIQNKYINQPSKIQVKHNYKISNKYKCLINIK